MSSDGLRQTDCPPGSHLVYIALKASQFKTSQSILTRQMLAFMDGATQRRVWCVGVIRMEGPALSKFLIFCVSLFVLKI